GHHCVGTGSLGVDPATAGDVEHLGQGPQTDPAMDAHSRVEGDPHGVALVDLQSIGHTSLLAATMKTADAGILPPITVAPQGEIHCPNAGGAPTPRPVH